MGDFHVNRVLVVAKPVTSCTISGSDVLIHPSVPLDRAVEIAAVSDHLAVYLLDARLVEKAFPLREERIPAKSDRIFRSYRGVSPSDDIKVSFQGSVFYPILVVNLKSGPSWCMAAPVVISFIVEAGTRRFS